jgi:hypothetical protein
MVPTKKSKSKLAAFSEFLRVVWDPDIKKPSCLSKDATKRRENVLKAKADVTSRISESTRSISFGTLASCYALLISNDKLAKLFDGSREWIFATAILALIAIIIDAAQYLFGYINIQQALAHEEQGYLKNWSRTSRQICFFLKQIFAYLGGFVLLVTIFKQII